MGVAFVQHGHGLFGFGLGIVVMNRDRPAVSAQIERDGAAQALRRAGNQDGFGRLCHGFTMAILLRRSDFSDRPAEADLPRHWPHDPSAVRPNRLGTFVSDGASRLSSMAAIKYVVQNWSTTPESFAISPCLRLAFRSHCMVYSNA